MVVCGDGSLRYVKSLVEDVLQVKDEFPLPRSADLPDIQPRYDSPAASDARFGQTIRKGLQFLATGEQMSTQSTDSSPSRYLDFLDF